MKRIPQQISTIPDGKFFRPPAECQERGFALILVISLMGFLLVLLLGMLAVVQVELAVSSTQRSHEEARQNALYGLNVALGTLQKQMGPDQRVSTSAQLFDKTLRDTSPLVNLTGVWDTVESNDDGSPKLIGWLISGHEDDNELPDGINPVQADGTPADPKLEALMLGGGSVVDGQVEDYVAAPKVDIDATGQYAYWVSDEGRKARINLASRTERGEAAFAGTTSNVQTRLDLSSPSRASASVLTGLESMLFDNDTNLAKNVYHSASQAELMLSEPGGGASWQDALPEFYHDTTFHSVALQTDTRNGGLKKDLSLLFELSEEDFAKTPYTGSSSDEAFDDWPASVLPPTDSNYTDPATNDGVSYVFKEPVPEYGANAFIRGPTWAYLRSFYRLYYDVQNNGIEPVIETRPFSPNTEHMNSLFPGKGGKHGYLATLEADDGGDVRTKDGFVNSTVEVDKVTEQVTRLTGHPVMPVMNRAICTVSLYNDQNVPEYNLIKTEGQRGDDGTTSPTTYEYVPTGGKTDALALLIEPFVYLWNPYNVAIEFDGGFKINMGSIPFLISVTPAGMNVDIISYDGLDSSDFEQPQMTGVLADWAKINHDKFFSLVFMVGDTGQPIRMEPGEVMVFSSSFTSPKSYKELDDEYGHRVLPLSAGFNGNGGLVLGRRRNTADNFGVLVENYLVNRVNGQAVYDNVVNPFGTFHQIVMDPLSPDDYVVNLKLWGDRYAYIPHDREKEGSVDSLNDSTVYGYIPQDEIDSGGNANSIDTDYQRIWLELLAPDGNPSVMGWMEGDFPKPVNIGQVAVQGKFPLFYYGFYQNPVTPDTDKVLSTSEFNGTMSPFGHADPQFANFIVDGPPYSIQTAPLTDSTLDEIAHDGDHGFFGTTYSDSGGVTHLTVSEIPTYPLQSLASLQHARLSQTVFQPGLAIGNSWATGMVRRDVAYRANDGRYTQYDLSYLSNEALFDSYFFSSLTPEVDLSGNVQQGANLETTLTNMANEAQATGEFPQLRNQRMAFIGDSESLEGGGSSALVEDLSSLDGFSASASYFGVAGGFNINSLSVDAWDSLLASTLGADYSYLNPSGGMATVDNDQLTILPRTTLPNATSDSEWLGPKGLTPTQRHDLAKEIVKQIKLRGPYLNLADFVNRELTTSSVMSGEGETIFPGKAGAIQAAIDSLAINSGQHYNEAYDQGVTSAFYKDNVTTKTGVGTPQYLTQADVLTPLAPLLSARSDTFVIRAYGNVKNPLDDTVVSEAWCEAVVQRVPAYVDSTDSANTPVGGLDSDVNKDFGRQFRILSVRWLSEGDV